MWRCRISENRSSNKAAFKAVMDGKQMLAYLATNNSSKPALIFRIQAKNERISIS